MPDIPKFDEWVKTRTPRDRVFGVARSEQIPDDIAEDYLRLTRLESGHNVNVRNSSKGARGFGQVMPDTKGGNTRTVGGRQYDLRDPDQNITAGLRYFAEGGQDPVARRLHYFGGPKARQRYERTGRIPNISDGNMTAAQYVQATGGKPQTPKFDKWNPDSDIPKFDDWAKDSGQTLPPSSKSGTQQSRSSPVNPAKAPSVPIRLKTRPQFGQATPEQQEQVRAGIEAFERLRPSATGVGELRRLDETAVKRVLEQQKQEQRLGPTLSRYGVPQQEIRRIAQAQAERPPEETAREQRVAQTPVSEKLKQIPKSLGLGLSESAATGLKSIAALAKKFDFTGEYAGKKASDLQTYKAGEYISRRAREILRSNPDLEQDFIIGKAPQAIGQSLSFLLGGLATKAPKLTVTILGAGMTAGSAYDEVRAAGGTDEEAVNAGLLAGAILGPTELIGMRGAMKAIAGTAQEATLKAALKTALREGRRDVIENALQEAGQELGQGLITGQRRSPGQIAEAAALGGIAAGVTTPTLTLASTRLGGRRGTQTEVQPPVEAQRAPVEPVETPLPTDISGLPKTGGLPVSQPSAESVQPTEPGMGPARSEVPQRFYHKDWGEVEVLEDQSGARPGRVKVAEVADPTKQHFPKRSDLTGRGNQRMVPVKAEPEALVPNLEAGLEQRSQGHLAETLPLSQTPEALPAEGARLPSTLPTPENAESFLRQLFSTRYPDGMLDVANPSHNSELFRAVQKYGREAVNAALSKVADRVRFSSEGDGPSYYMWMPKTRQIYPGQKNLAAAPSTPEALKPANKISAKPTTAAGFKEDLSLSQFVRKMGGIVPTEDVRGELDRLRLRETGTTGLVNQKAKQGNVRQSSDIMMQAANDAGFRDPKTGQPFENPGDFLYAVERDVLGNKIKVQSGEGSPDFVQEYNNYLTESEADKVSLDSRDALISLLENEQAGTLYERVINGTASPTEVDEFRSTARTYGVSAEDVEHLARAGSASSRAEAERVSNTPEREARQLGFVQEGLTQQEAPRPTGQGKVIDLHAPAPEDVKRIFNSTLNRVVGPDIPWHELPKNPTTQDLIEKFADIGLSDEIVQQSVPALRKAGYAKIGDVLITEEGLRFAPKQLPSRDTLIAQEQARQETADPQRTADLARLEEIKRRGMTVEDYARQPDLMGNVPKPEEIAQLRKLEAGEQASVPDQPKLPELKDNYRKPLKEYADTFYRETNANGALDVLPSSRRSVDMRGDFYLSNTPDLALGQETNKGILLEFGPGELQGQVNRSKPAWKLLYEQGQAEFIARHHTQGQYQKALTSVTIKSDAKMSRVERIQLDRALAEMEEAGWTKTTNPDGSISYRNPAPVQNFGPGTMKAGEPDTTTKDLAEAGTSDFDEQIEQRHGGFPIGRALFGERPRIDTLGPKSINPEAEARMRAAEGIQPPSVIRRAKEGMASVYHSFKRTFPEINPNKDDVSAVVNDHLRQLLAAPNYAKALAFDKIADITKNLGKGRMRVFSRNLILPDILKDIDAGLYNEKPLPFGYKDRAQIEADLATFQKTAEETPAIKDALERRQAFSKALTQKLVSLDLLPKEVLDDPRYYHRQVMEYVNNPAWVGTGASDVRLHQKGFQKGRTGGGDFNTRYQEAEFEWTAQALSLIARKETLARIQQIADIRPALDLEAKLWNDAHPEAPKTWQDFIPETHRVWQPVKGTHFYPTMSITERTMDKILSGEKPFEESDVREILALGSKRQQWVLPNEIAKTLDEFRPYRDEGPIANVWVQAQSSWKQWVLLNPVRVLKYNLNNISGDLDITLAYNPKILKQAPRAARELWSYQVKGQGSVKTKAEIQDAIKRGVIDSGLTIVEIPDINKTGLFRGLTSPDPNVIQRMVQSYWGGVKTFTTWRENSLRLAAYRHFKDQLSAGKKVYGASTKSQIDAVQRLEGNDAAAAKLARELIGDYGAVSHAGQWIRRHLIPFYSWVEINAPRYARLMRNLPHEGRSPTKAAATRVLTGAPKLAAKASLLYVAAQLWNHAMFPDEEKELRATGRAPHLILGRNEDGSIRVLRVEGALADALEWFGAEDLPYDVADVANGKKGAGVKAKLAEAVKAPPERLVQSFEPFAKTIFETASGRTAYPSLFEKGESFKIRPRIIRDRKENIARVLSLDSLYRKVTGRPSPPKHSALGYIVDSVLTYRLDPGEAAYWDFRGKTIDWAKEKGKEFGAADPTERSNALYYYKQATKWRDEKAAKKWLAEYHRLGGSDKGMAQSLRMGHPLGSIKQDDRAEFLESLTDEERGTLELAEKWYTKTYGEIKTSGRPPKPPAPPKPEAPERP